MRRIYVLKRERSFHELAAVLVDSELDLARVVSCTFPSRPEPRSATWTNLAGHPVIAYHYEPDIELRYAHALSPDWSIFETSPSEAPGDVFAQIFRDALAAEPFDEWSALRDDLLAGAYPDVHRAASAFRVAAKVGDPSVDGERELVEAITRAADHGARAAAEHIAPIATRRFEPMLREIAADADDLEVRLHLKRALDRILLTL